MALTSSMESPFRTDAELVSEARAGHMQAFEQIVLRYQGLVCSLAYSAVGDLRASEDIAQESFIAAWKGLGDLRKPGSLRSWLCGITRRLTANALRRNVREPALSAETLELGAEPASGEPSPLESAARRDDADLVWRALAEMPEIYREPLVLYYRQNQSVEAVARGLEISEDAVKQRLSRGRERLKADVAALVEAALRSSGPGAEFTRGVMLALPVSTASAKVAIGGALAGKAAIAGIGAAGALAGGAFGFLGGYLGYRRSLSGATTDAERAIIRRMGRANFVGMVGLFAVAFVFIALSREGRLATWVEVVFTPAAAALYLVVAWVVIANGTRKLAALEQSGAAVGSGLREYRSSARFLGLPLVHVKFGGGTVESCRPARGWIAVGNMAVGGLFAFGGLSAAPIAIGGLALGGVAIGGGAIGGLTLGGIGLGILAAGGEAMGWIAAGGTAVAVKAALGGFAVARDFAQGGIAHAAHANDLAARVFFRRAIAGGAARDLLGFIPWIGLLGVVPIIGLWIEARIRQRQKPL
jgi:RNA polymerase sigma factor (sigma-70 family)